MKVLYLLSISTFIFLFLPNFCLTKKLSPKLMCYDHECKDAISQARIVKPVKQITIGNRNEFEVNTIVKIFAKDIKTNLWGVGLQFIDAFIDASFLKEIDKGNNEHLQRVLTPKKYQEYVDEKLGDIEDSEDETEVEEELDDNLTKSNAATTSTPDVTKSKRIYRPSVPNDETEFEDETNFASSDNLKVSGKQGSSVSKETTSNENILASNVKEANKDQQSQSVNEQVSDQPEMHVSTQLPPQQPVPPIQKQISKPVPIQKQTQNQERPEEQVQKLAPDEQHTQPPIQEETQKQAPVEEQTQNQVPAQEQVHQQIPAQEQAHKEMPAQEQSHKDIPTQEQAHQSAQEHVHKQAPVLEQSHKQAPAEEQAHNKIPAQELAHKQIPDEVQVQPPAQEQAQPSAHEQAQPSDQEQIHKQAPAQEQIHKHAHVEEQAHKQTPAQVQAQPPTQEPAKPSAHEQVHKKATVQEQTHKQVPVEEQAHKQTPAEEQAHKQTPAEEQAHKQTPGEEKAHKQAPVEEQAHKQAPVEEQTHKQAHDQVPTEKTKQVPDQDSSHKDSPVKDKLEDPTLQVSESQEKVAQEVPQQQIPNPTQRESKPSAVDNLSAVKPPPIQYEGSHQPSTNQENPSKVASPNVVQSTSLMKDAYLSNSSQLQKLSESFTDESSNQKGTAAQDKENKEKSSLPSDPWLTREYEKDVKYINCIDYLTQISISFKLAKNTVDAAFVPIRHGIALLPSDTVATLKLEIPRLTGFTLEISVFILSILFVFLFFSIVFKCCLCRRSWSAEVSRLQDTISALEERLTERGRIGEELAEWNSRLVRQTKEYETQISFLRSDTSTQLKERNIELDELTQRYDTTQLEISRLRECSQESHLEHERMHQELELQLTDEKERVARTAAEAEERIAFMHAESERQTNLVAEMTSRQEQLMTQTTAYYEQMVQMKRDMERMEEDKLALDMTVTSKQTELDVMREDFRQLKVFESVVDKERNSLQKTKLKVSSKKASSTDGVEDELGQWEVDDALIEEEDETNELADVAGEASIREAQMKEEAVVEKIREFLDSSHLRVQLAECMEKTEHLEGRLRSELSTKEETESRMLQLEQESLTLQSDRHQSELSCKEAQKKLDILTQYFKERESEMQRLVGEQEVRKGQNNDLVEVHRAKSEQLEAEMRVMRDQLAGLRKELEESDRAYRRQVMELEKRAHENWLAARASEREVKEMKEEAQAMRQRLSDSEKARQAGPGIPPLPHPLSFLRMPPPPRPPGARSPPPNLPGLPNHNFMQNRVGQDPSRPRSIHSVSSETDRPPSRTSGVTSHQSNMMGAGPPPRMPFPPPPPGVPPMPPIPGMMPPIRPNMLRPPHILPGMPPMMPPPTSQSFQQPRS